MLICYKNVIHIVSNIVTTICPAKNWILYVHLYALQIWHREIKERRAPTNFPEINSKKIYFLIFVYFFAFYRLFDSSAPSLLLPEAS